MRTDKPTWSVFLKTMGFSWLVALALSNPKARAEERVQVKLPLEASKSATPRLPQPSESSSSFELQISSWHPRNFELGGKFGAAGAFGQGSLPQIGGQYYSSSLFSGWPALYRSLFVDVGLGLCSLSRQGTLALGSLTSQTDQSLLLVSGTLGLEFAPSGLKLSIVSPYIGAALLPTLALAPDSSLAQGTSATGIPFATSLGARFGLEWMSYLLGVSDLKSTFPSLKVGLVFTFGEIAGGDFFGDGVQAGLNFAI